MTKHVLVLQKKPIFLNKKQNPIKTNNSICYFRFFRQDKMSSDDFLFKQEGALHAYFTEKVNKDVFTFKQDSSLHTYLTKKLKEDYPTTVTYLKLKTDIANIIRNEHLYDPLNIAMIIGDHELEKALNVRVFHVYQLQKYVLEQMTLGFSSKNNIAKTRKRKLSSDNNTIVTNNNENESKIIKSYNDLKIFIKYYTLPPLLYETFTAIPFFPKHRIKFLWNEILTFFWIYILLKRQILFDPRNRDVCIVKNDPLGKALNVETFHKYQVEQLLRKNIFDI